VIVTVAVAVTVLVVIEKFAEVVLPAVAATDAGTWTTEGLLLVRVTTAPLDGAGAFSDNRLVVVEFPPLSVVLARVTNEMASGVTTIVSVFDTP